MAGDVLHHDGEVLLRGRVGVALGAVGIGLHQSKREWARVKCEYGPVKDGYGRESMSYLYKVLQASHRKVVILGVQQLHEIGSEEGTRARLGVDTTDSMQRGGHPPA